MERASSEATDRSVPACRCAECQSKERVSQLQGRTCQAYLGENVVRENEYLSAIATVSEVIQWVLGILGGQRSRAWSSLVGSYWGRLKLFVSLMAARHELLRGRDLTKLR